MPLLSYVGSSLLAIDFALLSAVKIDVITKHRNVTKIEAALIEMG